MKLKIVFKIALLVLLLAVNFSVAQTISGIFGSVGGKQINSTHQLSFTMGESLIGFSNNSSAKSYAGFWYTYNEGITTNVEDQLSAPTDYKLEQNYPNPFNPTTIIKYSIRSYQDPFLGGARGGLVTLKVFDVLGNEVTTLVNEVKPPGVYEVEFDGSNLSSGIYFYQIKSGNFIQTNKMVLMK